MSLEQWWFTTTFFVSSRDTSIAQGGVGKGQSHHIFCCYDQIVSVVKGENLSSFHQRFVGKYLFIPRFWVLYQTGFNELISFNLLFAYRSIQLIFDLFRKKAWK